MDNEPTPLTPSVPVSPAPLPPPPAPPPMMSTRVTPARSHTSQYAVLGASALLATSALVGWWYTTQQAQSTSDLNAALDAMTAATNADASATTDVPSQAASSANATDQTNPFNDAYNNPFE